MPHSNINPRQRQRAKQLRATMTRAETLLWRYIRAHRVDGLGFRRQVPIKNYIADLVCHSARLVVELDGESHDFAERQRLDAKRDSFFQSQGYRVLRFTNADVLSNLEGVVTAIRAAASEQGAPPSLTLPHIGERSDAVLRTALGGGNRPVVTDASSPTTTVPDKYKHLPSFAFGDNPGLADELLDLVMKGIKTATCSTEDEPNTSTVGEQWIVRDGRGTPRCVIETTEVTYRRFPDVDAAFAFEEGEGDRSLAYWRAAHRKYFSRQGRFSEDMMLMCERFRLVDVFAVSENVS